MMDYYEDISDVLSKSHWENSICMDIGESVPMTEPPQIHFPYQEPDAVKKSAMKL